MCACARWMAVSRSCVPAQCMFSSSLRVTVHGIFPTLRIVTGFPVLYHVIYFTRYKAQRAERGRPSVHLTTRRTAHRVPTNLERKYCVLEAPPAPVQLELRLRHRGSLDARVICCGRAAVRCRGYRR